MKVSSHLILSNLVSHQALISSFAIILPRKHVCQLVNVVFEITKLLMREKHSSLVSGNK